MVSDYINTLYYISITILALKSFFLLLKSGFKAQDFLCIYIITTCVLEIYCFVVFYLKSNVNIGIYYNIYCFFCMIFFHFYFTNNIKKKISILFNGGFILAVIFYLFFTKFYSKEFDIKIGILISLYYIFNSLLWFYYKISHLNEENKKITDYSSFWISAGLLIWSCFFIFRSIPMFFLKENDIEFLQVLKNILNVVNILMYIMFYFAILKTQKDYE